MAKAGGKAGETIQVIILTFFITGGLFAMGTLVLSFLVPGREDAVERQLTDLKNMLGQGRKTGRASGSGRTASYDFSRQGELWSLRSQFRQLEKQGVGDDLRTIISNQITDLNPSRFPEMQQKPLGLKSKTIQQTQRIEFSDVKMQDVLNFIGRVKSKNASIQLDRLTLNPAGRSRGANPDEQRWKANLDFHLYENPELKKRLGKNKSG